MDLNAIPDETAARSFRRLMSNFQRMGIMPYTIDNPRVGGFLWIPLAMSAGMAEITALEAAAQDLLQAANKLRERMGVNGQYALPMPAPIPEFFAPPRDYVGVTASHPDPVPPGTPVYGESPSQYVPAQLRGIPVPDPTATVSNEQATFEEFMAWKRQQRPHQYVPEHVPVVEEQHNPMVESGTIPGYAPPPGSRVPEPINPESRKPTKQ